MAQDVLAIRHVPFEDLGLLEPLLSARGYRHADRPVARHGQVVTVRS